MKLILTIALCLSVGSTAIADSPRMFDEYTNLPFSDEKVRLDNIAVQLKAEPNMVVWYLIFAERKACEGEARARALRAKYYLVKKHGIPADRIKWADVGYREHQTVEVWFLPRTVRDPGKPTPANTSLKRNEVQVKKCKSKYLVQHLRN